MAEMFDIGAIAESIALQIAKGRFSRGKYGQDGRPFGPSKELRELLNQAVAVMTPEAGPWEIPVWRRGLPYKLHFRHKSRLKRISDNETEIVVRRPPGKEVIEVYGFHMAREWNAQWRKAAQLLAMYSREWRTYLAWAAAKADAAFFVNGFVMGYDPRAQGVAAAGPFVLWRSQESAAENVDRAIWAGEEYFIEKLSRDEGGSFIAAAIAVKHFCFRDNVSFLFVAQSQDKVDDGTTDSLLGKVKHILRCLPAAEEFVPQVGVMADHWMIGPGWKGDSRSGQSISCSVRYPTPDGKYDPTCTIDGAPTTAEAAVSKRKTAMFIDEAAPIDEAADAGQDVGSIVNRAHDSTPCIVYVSTHRRKSSHFYKRLANPKTKRTKLHWSDNPLKAAGAFTMLYVLDDAPLLKQATQYLTLAMRPDLFHGPAAKARLDPKKWRRASRTERQRVWSPWYCKAVQDRINRPEDEAAFLTEVDGHASALGSEAFEARKLSEIYERILHDDNPRMFRLEEEMDDKWRLMAGWGPVSVWSEPIRSGASGRHHYVITTDSGHGFGGDASVADVWDVSVYPFDQVAQFYSRDIKPRTHARYVKALAERYNGAFVCSESNGPGETMISHLLDDGYDNVYYRERNLLTTRDVDDKTPGFDTNRGNRAEILIGEAREMFTADAVVIRSERTIEDMGDMEWWQNPQAKANSRVMRGRFQASAGKNDDCVVTYGLLNVAVRSLTGGALEMIRSTRERDARSSYYASERHRACAYDDVCGYAALTAV